ncbi:MAG: hypothetical protein VR69_14800 [Peptococcaceae bacterium BRH_c4b]|nr:MAG: hypothetical protein VR69_14800 [Peptococcaceae bacterium BRH_c4b]
MNRVMLLCIIFILCSLLFGCSNKNHEVNAKNQININKELLNELKDATLNINLDRYVSSNQVKIESGSQSISLCTMGADPYIIWNLAEPKNNIRVHMEVELPDVDTIGQMYWITSLDPNWNEQKSTAFEIKKGKSFYDIRIPLVEQVTDIRLDFGCLKDISFTLKSLVVWYKE